MCATTMATAASDSQVTLVIRNPSDSIANYNRGAEDFRPANHHCHQSFAFNIEDVDIPASAEPTSQQQRRSRSMKADEGANQQQEQQAARLGEGRGVEDDEEELFDRHRTLGQPDFNHHQQQQPANADCRRASQGSEERRTRRLLATFRLWGSAIEQQQQQQQLSMPPVHTCGGGGSSSSSTSATIDTTRTPQRRASCAAMGALHERPSSAATAAARSQRHVSVCGHAPFPQRPLNQRHHHHHHQRHHNPFVFVPTCASTIPFAATTHTLGVVGSSHLNEAISEKKLWQSLVMPLVLGCIIVLLAIWTRQISLVLVNETIVMIVMLGVVFVIMSGIAFWLAQDQQLDDERRQQQRTNSNHEQQHQQQQHRLSTPQRSLLHEPSRCGRHQRRLTQTDDDFNDGGAKCCNSIAIIDCQPPDYMSAMRDSLPVHLYSSSKDSDETKHLDGDSSSSSSGKCLSLEADELQLMAAAAEAMHPPPPSYDELHLT